MNAHAQKNILVETAKKRIHANQTHVYMVEYVIGTMRDTNVTVSMDIPETSVTMISVPLIHVEMAVVVSWREAHTHVDALRNIWEGIVKKETRANPIHVKTAVNV